MPPDTAPAAPTFEDTVCPLCGTASDHEWMPANWSPDQVDAFSFASRKFPEYTHFRQLLCPDCDLVFASPVPSGDWIQHGYEEADYDSAEEAAFASRSYVRLVQQELPDLSQDGPVLDVGTGNGIFLQHLLEQGFTDVQGVEPSTVARDAAPAELRERITEGFFQPADYPKDHFALITCFQTIEHLPDPLGFARGCLGLLRPGGALMLVGHNFRSGSARLLKDKSPIYDIEHLQIFSVDSMTTLLDKAGYDAVRAHPVSNAYPLHYWMKLAPLPRGAKHAVVNGLRKPLFRGLPPLRVRAGNQVGIGRRFPIED